MASCYHCGLSCGPQGIVFQKLDFCCNGCKTVYEIFSDNDLLKYYSFEKNPGKTPLETEGKYDYLDNPEILSKLLTFDENGTQVINFSIPAIHCSSCIWVLENLNKLNPGIKSVQVNFPAKAARTTFDSTSLSVRNVVLLLARIGYEPLISLENLTAKKTRTDNSLLYKLGVAGFTFGNIMFLSFPEYFEVNEFWLEKFKHVFRWLTVAFSIPVVFYAARHYFVSAIKGLRSGFLNIDVPIALGIAVLFLRSLYEIAFDIGTGFLDSLAGLVFFLLLGNFFKQKTYAFLSFERDYKSYFPIAVTRLASAEKKEEQVPIYELKVGDRILIRNAELIPVDGKLLSEEGHIDYSYVTGEADPVTKSAGDTVYAGGNQQGGIIEIEVLKPVEQSYLTQLWENEAFRNKKEEKTLTITDRISRNFTVGVISIAFMAGAFWMFYDPSKVLNVFTAVLIVACPCAIALAAPFTLGNLLRILGRKGFYLKNTEVLERMAQLNTVVFDKTGTLTTTKESTIDYYGDPLSEAERTLFYNTLRTSNHPLCRSLYQHSAPLPFVDLDHFDEKIGQGVSGSYQGISLKIGAYGYIAGKPAGKDFTSEQSRGSRVALSIDGKYRGHFILKNKYREGIVDLFASFENQEDIVILSGDRDTERETVQHLLPKHARLFFNQTPTNKLDFIKDIQANGKQVLMVGDGLNDSGALAQSDVGLVLSEDTNVFSPACDGIIDARNFDRINSMVQLSKAGIRVVRQAFLFSLLYNIVGLTFAVTGNLAPVVAAILMPLSSISIVAFTTVATYFLAKRMLPSHRA